MSPWVRAFAAQACCQSSVPQHPDITAYTNGSKGWRGQEEIGGSGSLGLLAGQVTGSQEGDSSTFSERLPLWSKRLLVQDTQCPSSGFHSCMHMHMDLHACTHMHVKNVKFCKIKIIEFVILDTC